MVSYGIGVLLIFIVVFSGFMIMITPIINELNGYTNTQIDDGVCSDQRKNAHTFINLVWKAGPVFFVLAGLCWAIVRALESRGEMPGNNNTNGGGF